MLTDEVVAGFMKLVGAGRLDDVRQVLAAVPQLVNMNGPHPFWGGRPQPLHVAIETTRREMVDLLLNAGADVNGFNGPYDHWSPLMLAIDRNQPAIQAELLRRGATIGLLEALMLADDELVEAQLRKYGLPAVTPNAGSILAFARTPFALDALLALGAPTDVRDRWGASPIEAMSRLGARGQALVRHLIERGGAGGVRAARRSRDTRAAGRRGSLDPEQGRGDDGCRRLPPSRPGVVAAGAWRERLGACPCAVTTHDPACGGVEWRPRNGPVAAERRCGPVRAR
jgi:hypothetical protein